MTDLNELFALPIGLKKVAEFDGIEFYGSESLNQKLSDALNSSVYTKLISVELKKLIDNGTITPVFSSKGIIKYIANLMMLGPNHGLKNIFAFFNVSDKKIFVLIDNNSFVGYINNDTISKLIIHELIHKVASEQPTYFLSAFKDSLNIFYKEFFKKIFYLKESKELDLLSENLYKTMFYASEHGKEINLKILKAKFDLFKKYSSLSGEKFDKILHDYFMIIRFHFSNRYDLIYNDKFKYILKVPYFVYRDKFGFFPTEKGCVQELIIPSEVISSISEYNPTPTVYSSIKKIL